MTHPGPVGSEDARVDKAMLQALKCFSQIGFTLSVLPEGVSLRGDMAALAHRAGPVGVIAGSGVGGRRCLGQTCLTPCPGSNHYTLPVGIWGQRAGCAERVTAGLTQPSQ